MRFGIIASCLLLAVGCTQTDGEPGTESQAPVTVERDNQAQSAPNFLIVVADDMGWSDAGAFGGEIRTPNIDKLADRGTKMSSFYVAPTCSPTRSMLMTGLDNHVAGLGTMAGLAAPNQSEAIGYGGQLHNRVVTIAEALKSHGYETMMAGKWHLAVDDTQLPNNRGFDQSFVLLEGGASHFSDRLQLAPWIPADYVENGTHVELDDDFYSTISYTDKLLAYFDQRDTEKPFLAYLAYTAPHDPLQVPDDWLGRYEGVYDEGPEAVKAARQKRLEDEGMIPAGMETWEPPAYPADLPLYSPDWEERSAEIKDRDTRGIEVHAAMIELLDQQFGRVIDRLETEGELENTYVIFFSDNGASHTSIFRYQSGSTVVPEGWDLNVETYGKPGTFGVIGREWANVSNTPWRLFKGTVGEGGIRSPLILAGPKIPADQHVSRLAHVKDIAATVYELSGIDPEQDDIFEGKILPEGVSLMPAIANNEVARAGFATELFNGRAIRDGDWKATFHAGEWQLFDLGSDPGEVYNLASSNPEKLTELVEEYDEYSKRVGVIVPEGRVFGMTMRARYPYNCDDECEAKFAAYEQEQSGSPDPTK